MSDPSVLFVCLGNICRSPTAEGVFRKLIKQELGDYNGKIDSAGTAAYHVGESPDPRSQKAAEKRGYDLSRIKARQLTPEDFKAFDIILAMDNQNLSNILLLATESGNQRYKHKADLFLNYASHFTEREVPDPYYGGESGFFHVIDLIEDASMGLIEKIKSEKNTQK